MKDKDLFNKIIKQEENTEVSSVKDATEDAKTEVNPSAKPQMPPVKPSTIVIIALFCVLVGLVYFFWPYIEQNIPFFNTTVNHEVNIQPVGYRYLIDNCHSVVIGKSVDSYVDAGDLNPDLYYTVHKFEVEQVLYGEPFMTDEKHLDTYTLGGTVTIKDAYGRPKKVTFNYTNAAELGNDRVLLFLDDNNNIINEKFGVYKLHNEETFYDAFSELYSVDKIKQDLALRDK